MAAIGIDLGTSYSCVGVFHHNRVDIIQDDYEKRLTPSYVAFTDEGLLVGNAAKNKSDIDPANTVFAVKRMIGREFSDPIVQKDLLNWPFNVIKGDSGKPQIVVTLKGETKKYYPEEILSMILHHLKEITEAQLTEKVTDAVITYPANYNYIQRQIIRDAAKIAGINVLQMICDSTAAAISFGINERSNIERNVLVYDLGGGTLSVSILNIKGGLFEVKATAGDNHIGGEDIDTRLVNYFADRFQKKHKCDLRQSPRAVRTLRTACERTKRVLSAATTATIICESIYEEYDLMDSISRAMFENLNHELLRSTLNNVAQVLKDANMSKSDITDIVLAGDSSRIPYVQQLLQDFFNGKQPARGIDTDEAIAYGAAIQAAIIKGDTSEVVKNIILLDVAPFSLGIETAGEIMTVLIPHNTTIPCKKSQIFSTEEDNQTTYTIKVYEGERSRTSENNLLGTFELTGIQPAPKGVPQIEVTFDVNSDGIIKVSAQDKSTGNFKEFTVMSENGRLSQANIDRLIAETEKLEVQNEIAREKLEAMNALKGYCFGVRVSLSNEQFANAIHQSEKDTIIKEITDTLAWIDAHQDAKVSEFENKQKELEIKLMPIMQKAYQGAAPGESGRMPGGIDPNMFQEGTGNSAGDGGSS